MVERSKTGEKAGAAPAKVPVIKLPASIGVRQLAELVGLNAIDVIKQLMRNGIMANINQVLDYKTAETVVASLGYQVQPEAKVSPKVSSAIAQVKKRQAPEGEPSALKPRPPVVTVMGHVDHGKTRLLDAIRQTNVMDSEAGGITQHIGAYQVEVNGQKITFLDTPGHEAFTAMRAHGAQITDIAILVVAADDGVMPQTLEAMNHARAAGVPIVVAVNKIDKPNANPALVKQQLADAGLVCEEWGGDTVCVEISAKQKLKIPDLLENLLIVAELEELKANPSLPATGVVIEAGMDKSKGPLATVLIQDGTLRLGNTVVVGNTWGRVRAMFSDTGKQVRRAEPATPVKILGLSGVPAAGDTLTVVSGEHQARAFIEQREREAAAKGSVRLDNLYDQITAGRVKELNVILKTDVQGSIEPIKASLERLGSEQVKVRIVHAGTGNVTESDVMLAAASKGLILSFSTGIEQGAKNMAENQGVDIRTYNIIYNLVDDVEKALKGLLEPTYADVVDARGEVRAIFPVGKKDKIAGVYITEGKATRGGTVRVLRNGKVIGEGPVTSLKRFKDDVREVAAGYECGVRLEGFNDYQVGDILEFYHRERSG